MLLYANGCSMTYGHELVPEDDDETPEGEAIRLSLAWPQQLGNHLGFDVVNDGIKGGSNDRIVRTTTDFVAKWLAEGKSPDELLIVIGWSNPVRTEIYITDHIEDFGYYKGLLPELYRQDHYVTDVKLKKMWEFYVSRMVDPVGDTRRSLGNILALQNLFTTNNIKYMFFDAAWKQWKAKRHNFQNLYSMIDMGRYYGFFDQTISFNDFTSTNELGIMPKLHPSARAHSRWAKVLKQFIDDKNILGI